jgi:hypothetical protein
VLLSFAIRLRKFLRNRLRLNRFDLHIAYIYVGWVNRSEKTVKAAIKHLAPWLAVAAIGGAVALAPIASADTDPSTPYGTDPMSPAIFGYHTADSPQVDVPF